VESESKKKVCGDVKMTEKKQDVPEEVQPLLNEFVCIKVKKASLNQGDPPHYFFYNGKLLKNTADSVVIDDAIKDIMIFSKTATDGDRVVNIRKCSADDMMHIADILEKRRGGSILRRLDFKLTQKIENLKNEIYGKK
jgi:hypothetical protein